MNQAISLTLCMPFIFLTLRKIYEMQICRRRLVNHPKLKLIPTGFRAKEPFLTLGNLGVFQNFTYSDMRMTGVKEKTYQTKQAYRDEKSPAFQEEHSDSKERNWHMLDEYTTCIFRNYIRELQTSKLGLFLIVNLTERYK